MTFNAMRKLAPTSSSISALQWKSFTQHAAPRLAAILGSNIARIPAIVHTVSPAPSKVSSRCLAQIRPEPFSEVWFTPSRPVQTPADALLGPGENGGQNDHKPPDERTMKLGKTLRTLSTLLPNILTTTLPPDIVSPNVVLHLFPSTHPHLPSVRGRVPYRAALWTAPVAWGSVPIVGNVRLRILSERVVRTGFNTTDPDPNSGNEPTGEEKLVVRWKTEPKSATTTTPSTTTSTTAANSTSTLSPSSASHNGNGNGGLNRGLSTLLGGDKPIFSLNSKDEFTGLFVFAFDDQGRIASHTIEHADENTGCDRTSRVVTLTDWLLGKAKLGRSDESGTQVGIPGLAVDVRICRDEWERTAREQGGQYLGGGRRW